MADAGGCCKPGAGRLTDTIGRCRIGWFAAVGALAVGALAVGAPGRSGSRGCTATLVDPLWVLTAAVIIVPVLCLFGPIWGLVNGWMRRRTTAVRATWYWPVCTAATLVPFFALLSQS
ncbi:hypothetical protein [Kitasatospora sp. NPDC090091]|uniref:hypothetical protein n=1 Tax=Kitasatospora sp. NPDC090091 TaxID=3364081 RepID=UPI003822C139